MFFSQGNLLRKKSCYLMIRALQKLVKLIMASFCTHPLEETKHKTATYSYCKKEKI